MSKAEPICISVRVLVVDDFQPWREHIRSILGSRPQFCVVAEVGDGLEAVHKTQELKPDLVLVDIGLTSLDGLEAAARIHLVAPAARIIFLTQNCNKGVVRTAFRNGAQGYVLKMDARFELLVAMQRVLRGHDFVSSGIRREATPARLKTRKRPLGFK